ncbi:MAG: ribosomal-protein-alanine N-acetyltransferase [Paracoccaceae bacterium]
MAAIRTLRVPDIKKLRLLLPLRRALSFHMDILPASLSDVEEVISWIATEEECRIWAGPAVTFPINKVSLLEQITFNPENSFSYKSYMGLLAFGQIMQKDDGRSHLARIITNPTCRGQGLARKICNHLVDYAFELGRGKVSLNVYRENSHALRLYESLGFKEQAEKSDDTNIFMLKT